MIMTKQTCWMAVVALLSSAEAFSVGCTRAIARTVTTTTLNLVPEQGKQLKAAMNAAYAHHYLEEEEEGDDETSTVAVAVPTKTSQINTRTTKARATSARAFVSRVFSLPSSMIRRHPHPILEGFPSFSSDRWTSASPSTASGGGDDDIVLFPIVGFQFVQDAPDHYSVLPTQSNPSCRLRGNGKQEEQLAGWYSPACHLDVFSDAYASQSP